MSIFSFGNLLFVTVLDVLSLLLWFDHRALWRSSTSDLVNLLCQVSVQWRLAVLHPSKQPSHTCRVCSACHGEQKSPPRLMAPTTHDKCGILYKEQRWHTRAAQEAYYVAALFPNLETRAWIATSNYSAVLAFGNNFAANPPKHTARKFLAPNF